MQRLKLNEFLLHMARPGLIHYLYDYRGMVYLQYKAIPEKDEAPMFRKESFKNPYWIISHSVFWREVYFASWMPITATYHKDIYNRCSYRVYISNRSYKFEGNILYYENSKKELNLTSTTVIDQVVELINHIVQYTT